MVYFTCNGCGESMKKNQVDKHVMRCRRCEVLSCMDCQKDFPGDSYKAHTSCISEAEKYSAKGWQPKANANKGAKKQAVWMERLEALKEKLGDSLDSDVKLVLDAIQGYDNVPRKRAKFINFCKNVLSRRFAPASIEKTWDLFEMALKEPVKEEDTTASPQTPASSKETTPEISNGTDDKEPVQATSFNQWETANLGNDNTNDKFRRLMGMGKSGGSTTKPFTSSKHASSVQDSTQLFANQEQGFEKARATTFSARGQGLGFASAKETEKKEKNKPQNKRQTFDGESDDGTDDSNSKENGHKKSNENEVGDELTVHRNGMPMFKGTNDKKSGAENGEKSKKKKRKAIEDEAVEENQTKKAKIVEKLEDKVTFDWIDCVLTILSKKGSSKMKKLKKKVVNEYLTLHPETFKTMVELESKFDKKIGKSKKLKISNDVVSVSTSRDD